MQAGWGRALGATALGLAGGAIGTMLNRADDKPGPSVPGLVVSYGATGAGIAMTWPKPGAATGAAFAGFLGALGGQFIGSKLGAALVEEHAPEEAIEARQAKWDARTKQRTTPPWSMDSGVLKVDGEPVRVPVSDPFAGAVGPVGTQSSWSIPPASFPAHPLLAPQLPPAPGAWT